MPESTQHLKSYDFNHSSITEAVDRVLESKRVRRSIRSRRDKPDLAYQEEKLTDLADLSEEKLFKADTVFPFILFPDTVMLDRTHLTIVHRFVFRVAKVTSARIEDLLTCDVQVGPFFGSLKFSTRYYMNQKTEDELESEVKAPAINYLRRDDALRLHKLVQGYIEVYQKKIDTSKIPTPELIELLLRLGSNEETRR
jgi:hypothetical protein